MKRLAAVLAVLMLAVGAALWWLPRVLAPQVGSPYEAAALLEQDVRAGGDGLLFCAEQVDPDEVYRALEACYPYAFSLHATVRPNRTVELQVQASRQARQAQAQSYAAALAADSIQEGMSDVQKLRALHDTGISGWCDRPLCSRWGIA